MKKITITLLLLAFVFKVVGQQVNTLNLPKGAYISKQPISTNGLNLKLNAISRSRAISYDSSLWLNYGSAIEAIYQTSELYSEYLWPDTNAVFNYDSAGIVVSTGSTFIHEIGNTFYLYSDNLEGGYGFANPVSVDSGYTIDSLAIGILYSRQDTSSKADTLIAYYFQSAPNSSDLPTYYYGPTTNYNGDTVFLPFMFYNPTVNAPLTNSSAPVTTVKIPLTESDTDVTNIGIKKFAITPLNVTAGNIVATAFTFKPWYSYTNGENVSDSESTLSFVSFDENQGALPYYTEGDNNNISSVIPTSVRYNNDTTGYDSLFVPSFAYAAGYAYDDHYIFYHVNYNQTLSGIRQVNSIVGSQSIYPNPASDLTTLKYTLKTGAPIIINVYDITGRLIQSKNEGNVNPGVNQQVINTQDLADGVYMVAIVANGNTSVTKLVVAR